MKKKQRQMIGMLLALLKADRHDPPQCGDGIDVTVAHGEQR